MQNRFHLIPLLLITFWGLALLLPLENNLQAEDQLSAGLRLATFQADITPPLGDGVGIGFVKQTTSIETPLLAKGIILQDSGGTYILCALDLCGLCNDSYDLFRKKIGEAAGIKPEFVAVQSLHQHTAPVCDANARRILFHDDPDRIRYGLKYVTRSAGNIAQAVRTAMKSLQPVTHVGTAKVKVDRVASNRRVPKPDGSLIVRASVAKAKHLQDAPEGLIDPWLRTITFYSNQQPLVQLHYYASHPQTSAGGKVNYDVPGIARERLETETGIPQIYFTGCGGNIAMGKYNDGSPEAKIALTNRFYNAMARAAKYQEHRKTITPIQWNTRDVNFPLRRDPSFSNEAQQAILKEPKAGFSAHLKAAMILAWNRRVQSNPVVQFSSLSIANVRIVHLPGEPFVQFQLAAQKSFPDQFVAVAGYGECAMWYLGEDRIYSDRGGYEQTWAFTGPCAELINKTISSLIESN